MRYYNNIFPKKVETKAYRELVVKMLLAPCIQKLQYIRPWDYDCKFFTQSVTCWHPVNNVL